MNATSSSKHHGITTALITVAVVLLFYVLTWPIVELDYFRTLPQRPNQDSLAFDGVELRPSFVYQPIFRGPYRWTDSFYYPIHHLRLMNGGDNVLQEYYSWWHDKWWRKHRS